MRGGRPLLVLLRWRALPCLALVALVALVALAPGASAAASEVAPEVADATEPATAEQRDVVSEAVDVPVELVTATGTLYGSMRRPAGSAPVPVALIIAGSGPTDRDGNSPIIGGRNDSLKLLASALAARGIASVRYDKRGIAASAAAGPDESALRFGAYVDDAAAWVAQLAADPRHLGVVVIGHS